jgi:uncharacterized protein
MPLNLSPGCFPNQGTPITSIDLDITLDCNLRCIYCFKEKLHKHMPKQVAFDAIAWLILGSGAQKNLRVNFMGGEPLLQFALIKKIVPFAKRRASYYGKNIHFSTTTNNTLITDEIISFWKQWGMGFHCSIDGIPEVQNINRPHADGSASSIDAESGIQKILAYQPSVCARCTITPKSVTHLLDNYNYFKLLGFTNIALVCSDANTWDTNSIAALSIEVSKVIDMWVDDMRKGCCIVLKYVDEFIKKVSQNVPRSPVSCGAGRGMVLIGIDGSIWPCHRWNKEQNNAWLIGSIYKNFSDQSRKNLDIANQSARLSANCEGCEASLCCSGGCLAENLEMTGDIYYIVKEKCKIQQIWFRNAKRAHDVLLDEKCLSFMKKYYPNF